MIRPVRIQVEVARCHGHQWDQLISWCSVQRSLVFTINNLQGKCVEILCTHPPFAVTTVPTGTGKTTSSPRDPSRLRSACPPAPAVTSVSIRATTPRSDVRDARRTTSPPFPPGSPNLRDPCPPEPPRTTRDTRSTNAGDLLVLSRGKGCPRLRRATSLSVYPAGLEARCRVGERRANATMPSQPLFRVSPLTARIAANIIMGSRWFVAMHGKVLRASNGGHMMSRLGTALSISLPPTARQSKPQLR